MSAGKTRTPMTREQKLEENRTLRITTKDHTALVSSLTKQHQALMRLTRAVTKAGKTGAKTVSGNTVHRRDVDTINHQFLTELRKLSKHYSAALHKRRPPTPGGQGKCIRAKMSIRNFFNELDTPGVNWDAIMEQNTDMTKNGGITNNKTLTNLFTLYYYSAVLQDGSPLIQTENDKTVIKVTKDPLFMKYFGKTLEEIEARGTKNQGKKIDINNFKYKYFRIIIAMNVFKKSEGPETYTDDKGKKQTNSNPPIEETPDLKKNLEKANESVVSEKMKYLKEHPRPKAARPVNKKTAPPKAPAAAAPVVSSRR